LTEGKTHYDNDPWCVNDKKYFSEAALSKSSTPHFYNDVCMFGISAGYGRQIGNGPKVR